MSDEKVLTKEIAEQYVEDPDSVNLSEFTAIEDDAAEVLAGATTDRLILEGVEVESLSRFIGVDLHLNGLKSLSDAAAESLSKHTSGILDLSGLTSIPHILQGVIESPSLAALREVLRRVERSPCYSFSAGGVVPMSVDFKDAVLEQNTYDDDGLKEPEPYFFDEEQVDNTYLVPWVQVDGFGPLSFPLSKSTSGAVLQELKGAERTGSPVLSRAPFGRGTDTITDFSVRKTWQVEGSKLALPSWFSERVEEVLLKQSVERLGEDFSDCSDDSGKNYELVLQKLLIYEPGDFFGPHADHETQPGMLGSLIVILPTEFTGGELVVTGPAGNGALEPGAGREITYNFAANSKTCMQYAAFYGDCCHEVKPVTSGLRVCLTYNIVPTSNESNGGSNEGATKPDRNPVEDISETTMELAEEHLKEMLRNKSSKEIIYLMDHHYSEQSLCLEFLKGRDTRVASLLASLIDKCNRDTKDDTKLTLRFAFLNIENFSATDDVAAEWYPNTAEYAIVSDHADINEEGAFKVSHYQFDAGNQGGGIDSQYRQAIMIVEVATD